MAHITSILDDEILLVPRTDCSGAPSNLRLASPSTIRMIEWQSVATKKQCRGARIKLEMEEGILPILNPSFSQISEAKCRARNTRRRGGTKQRADIPVGHSSQDPGGSSRRLHSSKVLSNKSEAVIILVPGGCRMGKPNTPGCRNTACLPDHRPNIHAPSNSPQS